MRIFLIITSRFLHENEYLSYSSSLIEEISPSSTVPSRPSVKYGMSVLRVPFFIAVYGAGEGADIASPHHAGFPDYVLFAFGKLALLLRYRGYASAFVVRGIGRALPAALSAVGASSDLAFAF